MGEHIIKGHVVICSDEDWEKLEAAGKVDVFRNTEYSKRVTPRLRVVVRPFGRNTMVAATTVILGHEVGEFAGRIIFLDGNPCNLQRANILVLPARAKHE